MRYQRGDLWWIESAGGPLLLLDNQYLPAWLGHAPAWEAWMDLDSVGLSDDQPQSSQPTDYERACQINGYVGILDVGGGQGVVLSGDWLATAWLPLNESEGILIRWIHGVDQAGLLQRLMPITSADWNESIGLFRIRSQPLSLFDSAWPGEEAPERLLVALIEGEYTIDTAIVLPDQQTELVLHRLRRR